MRAIRIYRLLVRLYPAEYRVEFGEEMAQVFGAALQDCTQKRYMQLVCRELIGLAWGALRERWVSKGQDSRVGEEFCECVEEPARSVEALELAGARRRVQRNVDLMVDAIANHQFDKARRYAREEERAREYLRSLEEVAGLAG